MGGLSIHGNTCRGTAAVTYLRVAVSHTEAMQNDETIAEDLLEG
jgi:hypothetical protein